uniref:FHA domain-containing protein n=1 Tax=Arabis nemorensis TaxID=586526 RepID=A0A565CXA9_9BRAS
MEAPPWIRESEEKDLVDGYILHHPVDFKISGKDTSESSNAKRKAESSYGLFCVMRKRACRHKYVDDIFPDLEDNPEKFLLDEEDMIVDDCCSSGSDTELSECSEFDVISEHVLQDMGLMGESNGLKSLAICNFPWPIEDEGALVSKLSSETQNSIFLLSPDEVNEENGVGTKEDVVLSTTSASPRDIDPQICSGHSNDIPHFHSERKRDQMSCIPVVCEDILRCRINKEDPQIQCNSDNFKKDSDKSSETEVRYDDVVNMQASLEKMSSNDELRLWDKDDDPIPIGIDPPAGESSILLETGSLNQNVRCINENNVLGDLRLWNKDDDPIPIGIDPPAGESSILLETCSLHQNVSFDNEYNVRGDHIGLEITPISLTKTLEGPSRSLSVCGSLAGRNLPLMEESSGACSSLDINVSSSENRDAKLAQTPSTLYQEEVNGEDEICFSDIDAMIHRLNLVPEDSDSCLNREEWNMSKHPRHTLLGLEHCTRTSTRRALVFQGAIAVLHCRDSKHFIRKHEVIIGRSSHGLKVDIDLGKDGYGSKISRRQALVKLENNGSFSLKNLEKRHILVNGEKLNTGQIGTLASCSSINFKGIVFEFKINKEAVRQFLKNNTRRNSEDDAKFRWCE